MDGSDRDRYRGSLASQQSNTLRSVSRCHPLPWRRVLRDERHCIREHRESCWWRVLCPCMGLSHSDGGPAFSAALRLRFSADRDVCNRSSSALAPSVSRGHAKHSVRSSGPRNYILLVGLSSIRCRRTGWILVLDRRVSSSPIAESLARPSKRAGPGASPFLGMCRDEMVGRAGRRTRTTREMGTRSDTRRHDNYGLC